MRAQEASIAWEQLQSHLAQLQAMMQDNNMQGIISLLQQLVSGFRPGPVVDNVALEQSQHSQHNRAAQANSL